MKKFLTLALTAFFAFGLSSFAQEEDVTNFIDNAGFDEDLTFQLDGTMKEAISTDTSLSGRSWAYIAADSTVCMHVQKNQVARTVQTVVNCRL